MYKVLPILLFVIIFSQNRDDVYLQSDPKVQAFKGMLDDMKDTTYVPTSYSEYIDYKKSVLKEEINIKVNGLISDMFIISTELEIIDTAYCNEKAICIPSIYSHIILDSTDFIPPKTDNKEQVALPLAISSWSVSPVSFEFNETIVLSIDNREYSDGDYVGIFVGDECRGLAERIYFPIDGSYHFSALVYSNVIEGEKLDFKYYNALNNEVISYSESIDFVANANMGNGLDPFVLRHEVSGISKPVSYDINRTYIKKENMILGECDTGYVDDCSIGDTDCCPESWIGDGECDGEKEARGCNLLCYDKEDEDCSSNNVPPCDGTNDGECLGKTTVNSEGECPTDYVKDCADNDCCPESYMGDSFPDCEDQKYGCDLHCYNYDYGDCHYIKPNVEEEYSNKGIDIDIIYEQVINKNSSIPLYNPTSFEFGIITSKIRVNVFYDEKVKLSAYQGNITNLINSTHPSLPNCDDCISFASVDMDSLRGVNEEVKSTISLNRDDIYNDSWAVIIGIDNYENLSNLDYAVADAEAVKEMLIGKFDYSEENVKLLLNEEANKANIVNVISNVSLKAGENDRILVFFAGHGETMDLPAGGEMGFLLPVDGNENNLYASAVRMDDLKDLSYLSKSKHMLFLVDACYGGLAAVGTRSMEPNNTPNYIEKISNIKSRQIITAGGKAEKVIEKSEWGHSAYTKNLLSGLNDELADINEDGYITALELGSYLSEKVTFDSESQQTPQLRRLTSDEGEFVFFGTSNNGNVGTSKANIYKSNNNDLGTIYEMSPKNTWKAIQGFQRCFIVSTDPSGGEGVGFISSADRYLNNGKQILSFSGEWSFYEHQSTNIYYHVQSIYIQNHLTPSSDLMWTYGAGIIVTEFFADQPHFGYTLFVGFLRLGSKLKFNKKVSKRFNRYGEVRIGYRFMLDESDYIMRSGIEIKASMGVWQRRLPK